jgi:hypothetical protein
MRRKVNFVEIVYGKHFGCFGVVGSFEAGNIHIEDFVVLEVAGRFAGENAEEREDEDGEGHQLGNDGVKHLDGARCVIAILF